MYKKMLFSSNIFKNINFFIFFFGRFYWILLCKVYLRDNLKTVLNSLYKCVWTMYSNRFSTNELEVEQNETVIP